jgi:hypothetical protein
MTTLKPTEARLALAEGIDAGDVTDHGWIRGHITWGNASASQVVTGRVAEFRVAGLLEGPGDEPAPRMVRLNAAGQAWLAEHGGGAT